MPDDVDTSGGQLAWNPSIEITLPFDASTEQTSDALDEAAKEMRQGYKTWLSQRPWYVRLWWRVRNWWGNVVNRLRAGRSE